MSSANAFASGWSNPYVLGRLVNPHDNLRQCGHGTTSPGSKLEIKSGWSYRVPQNPANPCSISGLPAIKVRWEIPDLLIAPNCTGFTGITPYLLDIHGVSPNSNPPNTPFPILQLDQEGRLGVGATPGGGYQMVVGGQSHLNGNLLTTGTARITGNTQVQQKFRINSGTLAAADWINANFPFAFSVDGGNARFLGNVQLGTGAGNTLLEQSGNARFAGSMQWGGSGTSSQLDQNGNARFGGSVRIGPQAAAGNFSGYRLSVDGPIIAKRAVVQMQSWADDVFQPGYKLRSLNDVQEYIAEHGRLPEVPSEKEVKEEGLSLGKMNEVLLRKVEELTLYLLRQQTEIDALKKKTLHL